MSLDPSYRARMERCLAAEPSAPGENAAPSVSDMAMADTGTDDRDLPSGPEPQRMGSGDHLNPVQFADQLRTVDKPEVPAVHVNPTGYYGHPDQPGDTNAR